MISFSSHHPCNTFNYHSLTIALSCNKDHQITHITLLIKPIHLTTRLRRAKNAHKFTTFQMQFQIMIQFIDVSISQCADELI